MRQETERLRRCENKINCVALLFREKRIFPLALVNFITAYGGGFQRETGKKPRIYSMDDLIETVN